MVASDHPTAPRGLSRNASTAATNAVKKGKNIIISMPSRGAVRAGRFNFIGSVRAAIDRRDCSQFLMTSSFDATTRVSTIVRCALTSVQPDPDLESVLLTLSPNDEGVQ